MRKPQKPDEGFLTSQQLTELIGCHLKQTQDALKAGLEAKTPLVVQKNFKIRSGAYVRSVPHYKMLT
tara:strand:- start:104 stop:304 length:201 start_codon:yes stop_codon:yes gene_type:complete